MIMSVDELFTSYSSAQLPYSLKLNLLHKFKRTQFIDYLHHHLLKLNPLVQSETKVKQTEWDIGGGSFNIFKHISSYKNQWLFELIDEKKKHVQHVRLNLWSTRDEAAASKLKGCVQFLRHLFTTVKKKLIINAFFIVNEMGPVL